MQTRSNRFGFESTDGRNSIYLTGRLHLDVADYLDYRPASKFASVQTLNSGVNARRARLGVTGKFAEDWGYTLVYDFGGSSDGFPPLSGAPDSAIENAYITCISSNLTRQSLLVSETEPEGGARFSPRAGTVPRPPAGRRHAI